MEESKNELFTNNQELVEIEVLEELLEKKERSYFSGIHKFFCRLLDNQEEIIRKQNKLDIKLDRLLEGDDVDEKEKEKIELMNRLRELGVDIKDE